MSDAKLLSIYLNDHLAGATAGRELARRAHASNRDNAFGEFLGRLADEIEEDRQSLLELMRRLDVSEDRPKQAGLWLAEKAGRLKLNGRLWGYSPLSRVVELEGLLLGVTGKLSLWRALERLATTSNRLAGIDLARLIERAERQQSELDEQRLSAVEEALG